MYCDIKGYFSCIWFHMITALSIENIVYKTQILRNLMRLPLWPWKWSPFMNVPWCYTYLLDAWFYANLLGQCRPESYKQLVGHEINFIGGNQSYFKWKRRKMIIVHIFSYPKISNIRSLRMNNMLQFNDSSFFKFLSTKISCAY